MNLRNIKEILDKYINDRHDNLMVGDYIDTLVDLINQAKNMSKNIVYLQDIDKLQRFIEEIETGEETL